MSGKENTKLAPSSMFQESHPSEDSEDFKKSVLSNINFLTAVFSIASHFILDGESYRTLPKKMINEFRNNLEILKGINLKAVRIKKGVVSIPFEKEGGKFEARIWQKRESEFIDKVDSEWGLSDKFVIQVVRNTKTAPQKETKPKKVSPKKKENPKKETKPKTKTPSLINKDNLDKAAQLTADCDVLVFDIDYTLNRERATPVDEEVASILYDFIVYKEKKIRVISGRSLDDFKRYAMMDPLIDMLIRKNRDFDIVLYVSDGAGKYTINRNGEFVPDEEYNRGFTGIEARIIENILDEMHAKIDKEQRLSERGIDKYIKNTGYIKFEYSPYGKIDSAEYDFETNKEKAASYEVPRLTRKELANILIKKMNEQGVKDVTAIVSGKTTIGFVRKDASKKKAMEDILKSDGPSIYYGDEMGVTIDTSNKRKTGNDHIIAELATSRDDLEVISLNGISEDEKVEMPEGVVWVGGFCEGSLMVLETAYNIMQQSDPVERQAVDEIKSMLHLCGVNEIKLIHRFEQGHGMHEKYFKAETKDKNYIITHVNPELYDSPLDAARYEVWMVKTLESNGIPVVPLLKKKTKESWEENPEDSFIFKGSDGKYHLIYEFIEQNEEESIEAGSFRTMNDGRFENMVKLLAKMHRILLKKECPYERIYREDNQYKKGNSILDIIRLAENLRNIKHRLDERRAENPHRPMTRGELFAYENAYFIADQMERLGENLNPQIYSELRRLSIHGDFHPPNIIFKGDEVLAVIDWEYSKDEAMIYDFVSVIRPGDPEGRFNIENMKSLVQAYHSEHPLSEEEIKAMPEIFRCKLLDRLSRFAVPRRHHEHKEFNFENASEEEMGIMLMDKDDRLYEWYQGLINALWNLDEMIWHGTFEREITRPLLESLESQKSGEILEECFEYVKENTEPFTIELSSLRDFSVKDLLEDGTPIYEVAEKDAVGWTKEIYYYTNGWARLQVTDVLIFESDKVLIYRSENGNINIAIRGNKDDRVKKGRDRAKIEVIPDEKGKIKNISMQPVGDYDLSRTAIALQLLHVGMNERFPELAKALRYQIVWQDIKAEQRYREQRDTSFIDMELINKAINQPESITDPEIRTIEGFVYLKTKAVRRRALVAMAALYDAGKISRKEFRQTALNFIKTDIEEDKILIERGIKNSSTFVPELFKNLYGKDVTREDIQKVEVRYHDQGPEKEIFIAKFYLKNRKKPYVAAISLIREDEFNVKMDDVKLRKVIKVWREISQKGILNVAIFGSDFWQYDYRAKKMKILETQKGPKERFWRDNILIMARQYIKGKSLSDVLEDEKLSDKEKAGAIKAARECTIQLFKKTKKELNEGYFIEDPSPGQFIVFKKEGTWHAVISDLDRLVDYPSLDLVLKIFDKGMPAIKKSKGNTKECLKTIYNNSKLKDKKSISVEKDLLPARYPYKRTTVYTEVRMLKALGILGKGEKGRTHQLRDYVRKLPPSVIDKICAIPEMDLSEIPKEKIPFVKAKIDMIILNHMNIELLPAVEKGKTLWHVIPKELLPVSVRSQFESMVNRVNRLYPELREKVILVDKKDMKDRINGLISENPGNLVDAAIMSKKDLKDLPQGVKALVFRGKKGGVYGYRQLEGIVAALRALQGNNATALRGIYEMLTGKTLSCDEADILKYIEDPRKLAEYIIFDLKPIEIHNHDDLRELNKNLLALLEAA